MLVTKSIPIYVHFFFFHYAKDGGKMQTKNKNMVEDVRIWKFGRHGLRGNLFNMASSSPGCPPPFFPLLCLIK